MARGIENLPKAVRQALLMALLASGTKPPTEDDPGDDSVPLMIEAIEQSGDTGLMDTLRDLRDAGRRMATRDEAAVLIDLAGPCRFQPGDIVKWNPDLYEEGMFPPVETPCVVTQVFKPAMHDITQSHTNIMPIRNDIAVAYMKLDGDKWSLAEYTYDSRRFVLVQDAPKE